ncbi:MAG: ABC transporter substrate-binding protein [Gemmatimonadota bacterium]|nr:MAG: ABC transporter substrate-binding protein [Gemmatimonadota bacterium]
MLSRNLTVAAVTVAVLLACESREQPGEGALVDDTGHGVSLQAPPTRIVSLAPGHTELLFAIGAGDRLVGRTRWCDYPPAVESIPSVGDGLNPSVEGVLAQNPDLVVFYASPANEPAIARLQQLGIATVSLLTDDLEDFMRAADLLGDLTGESERNDSLVASLRHEISSLDATRPRDSLPTVLLVAWGNPPVVIGGASFLSEIVELAGARNAFADVDRPSLTVSIETIVERNADLVLIASDSGIPAWTERPEWRVVPAVRDRRFIVVHGTEFSRPSFRAPAAVRRVRAALEEWRQP